MTQQSLLTADHKPKGTMENTEDEQECLRREIERLNAEIMEANEERAQAAQYGLAILEEKQALQEQFEDLQALYHSTNKELSNTILVRFRLLNSVNLNTILLVSKCN